MKRLLSIDLLFFLSLFLIFLLPPTDPDLGWQLRCGQEFWQKHTFCNLNQFSVLLPNYSWPNHYWLYQALIFPIYHFFGFWGLTVFSAFLTSFAFFFFYKNLSKNNLTFAILLTCLIIAFTWDVFNLGIRSQLLSFFFFSLLLFLFSKINQIRPIGLIIPLVFLLWANTHGGSVILGIYLLIFFFLYSLVRHCERSVAISPSKRCDCRVATLLAMTPISFLATLLNPFGWRIYEDAFRHFAGSINLSQIIAEWVPPSPFLSSFILGSLIVFFVLALFSRQKKNLLLFLFTLPLAFLALKARRNTPFYFLFFFFSLEKSGILKKWPIKEDLNNTFGFSLTIFLLLITLSLSFPISLKTNSSFLNYTQNSSVIYPLKTIEFLKKQPDKGNIFNRYEWGGFLIWFLPEQKIFVDGRMPAWPAESAGQTVSPYTIYLETLQTQPGWQKTLKEYHISWILIVPNTFMDLLLKENPEKFGWKEAYRDKIAVLYQKL